MQAFLFWLLSATAIGSAVVTVSRKNPLSSALALTLCLVSVAGLFASLAADLLFVVQLLVYAGAVMVLVVYVIMLLNLRDRDLKPLGVSRPRAFASTLAGVLFVGLLARALSSPDQKGMGELEPGFGSVESMAVMLFTKYLYPFEIVSVLLLAAMVGVVVLAMKKL